jgi:hypothetical protein
MVAANFFFIFLWFIISCVVRARVCVRKIPEKSKLFR